MTSRDHTHYYLVGIKGVAMAALAHILVDAGKTVRGCDVADEFVTQPQLDGLNIPIDTGFDHLPDATECVIYTAAHQGPHNPIVTQAKAKDIPTYSHAAALADWANAQQPVAVCGTSGKSTTTAMITWIMTQLDQPISYSIGVGSVPGLNSTGQWRQDSSWFVTEADEYVTNPQAPQDNQPITPRFSYLQPSITVCTNLKYEHTDVYQSFNQLQTEFAKLFAKTTQTIIANADDPVSSALADQAPANVITFGTAATADFQLLPSSSISKLEFSFQDQIFTLEMKLPGTHNHLNALAAIAAVMVTEIETDISKIIEPLRSFSSTKRRFEFIGKKNDVTYYDDYAHHPQEIAATIATFNQFLPDHNKVIAFQSHTFSRTKNLQSELVAAFAQAEQVVMLDIFASAREAADNSISSDILCQQISDQYGVPATNLHTLDQLAEFCQNLPANSAVITLGAGDIYQVHEMI